jgi:hypothetical protein
MRAVNLVRISVRSRNRYESLISSGRLGLLRNRALARQIQAYDGNYDDLLDTQTTVFRRFRNDGAREQFGLGVSVFDQRPAADIVALARENPGFAAYLRSQREWAIVHFNLLANIAGRRRRCWPRSNRNRPRHDPAPRHRTHPRAERGREMPIIHGTQPPPLAAGSCRARSRPNSFPSGAGRSPRRATRKPTAMTAPAPSRPGKASAKRSSIRRIPALIA